MKVQPLPQAKQPHPQPTSQKGAGDPADAAGVWSAPYKDDASTEGHSAVDAHWADSKALWADLCGREGRVWEGVESGDEENKASVCHEVDVQSQNHSEEVDKFSHELAQTAR